MTSFERFENRLPTMLDELAVPRLPDYADDLFARTAATRQRPGWSFPERWLPMSALSRRFAAVPNIPWRVGVAVALLIVAAIIGLLVAGSRLSKVPAPFGPAGNGVIPYVSHGNLYVGDLTTGASRLLVDGSEDIGQPQFSPDGTRLAYIQLAPGTAVPAINIFVVRSDGANVTQITPQPIVDADWKWIGWTPDSRRIAVVYPVDGVNQLDMFDASRNASVQRISAAAGLDSLRFRPPNGAEILFRASAKSASGIQGFGLYRMNADGSNVRLLAEPAVADDTLDLTSAVYSADGSRIFYNRWTPDASVGDPGCCQLYVMNADGSNQHEFIPNPGTAWDGDASVSPDGTLIAFWHNPNDRPSHGLFLIRADGTSPLIETGPSLTGLTHWVWAPDSSKILMFPNDASNSNAYLLDPEGGPWATVPWLSDNDIDWQRIAP
jgi:Tol biopolymer transport system component